MLSVQSQCIIILLLIFFVVRFIRYTLVHADKSLPCVSSNPHHYLQKTAHTVLNQFAEFLNVGKDIKRFCPCCGWTGTVFESIKNIKDRRCPVCGAVERHRLVCTILANSSFTTTTLPHPFRLLHFGPHETMEKNINLISNVDQISVDYFYPGYKYSDLVMQADVTNLLIPTNFAQGIIILHVLEHISELEKAFSELVRVLHPNGWIIIEVPCKSGNTIDCRDSKTDAERIKCAGQHDHVWKFGFKQWKELLDINFKSCHKPKITKHLEKQILPKFKAYCQFICYK